MANPIQTEIDGLLSAQKRIVGNPAWTPSARDGQLRWFAPLAIEGQICPLSLLIDAYPAWVHSRRFNVLLTYEGKYNIWRVEVHKHASHVNKPPVPSGCVVGLITGPHHHSWWDNRHLATQSRPPEALEYAQILASNMQTVENVLRWFCNEVGIEVDFDPPAFPNSNMLV